MRIVSPKLLFIILSVFWINHGFSQVNQYDENGERHGTWHVVQENNTQPGFTGQYEHGKEIGTFKFYYNYKENPAERPVFTKTFHHNSDTIDTKFYTKSGTFLKSEGQYVNRNREGEWRYYKKDYKDNLLMIEHYKNGKLEGLKTTYFPNGTIAETVMYKAGIKNGEKKVYAGNGQLIQEYIFKDNTLHGPSTIYNAKGEKLSEGNYKKGRRDGEWKFYTNDKIDSIQTYPLPHYNSY